MLNKRFEHKETGETVVIKNDDGIWFTLNTGGKIKKDSFFSKYSEMVDPSAFFSPKTDPYLGEMANKLSQIDPSKVVTDNTQGPMVKRVDESGPSYENQMASNIEYKQQMVQDFIEKQKIKERELSQYRQIDDDDAAARQLLEQQEIAARQQRTPQQQGSGTNPNYPEFDPNIKRDRDKTSTGDYYRESYEHPREKPDEPIVVENPEEESYKFFKGFKKNHKVTIELSFDEFIADPEFLKLMMNNFEADVIKYYTGEIFKNIATNPKKVEEEIYNQLEDIILNNKKTGETPKRRTTRKPKKIEIKKEVVKKEPEKVVEKKENIDFPYDKMIPKGIFDGVTKYAFLRGDKEIVTTPEDAKKNGYKPKLK